MRPRLFVLIGLPGSGKSTRAQQMIEADPYHKRVSRDHIRRMLDGSVSTSHIEPLVTDIERQIVTLLVKAGYNAIIDDTNLSIKTQQMWSDVAFACGAKMDIIDLRHVPVEECIRRDLQRVSPVGASTITRMYEQYIAPIAGSLRL